MKTLKITTMVLAFFLLSGCSSLQVKTLPITPIEITEVVNVPNQSKSDIFNFAREWFTTYFVSGEAVIDYENKDAGTIIGKSIAKNGYGFLGSRYYKIHYKLKVDVKDNKMRITGTLTRYTQTDNRILYTDSTYTTPERESQAKTTIKEAISNLKDYVLNGK